MKTIQQTAIYLGDELIEETLATNGTESIRLFLKLENMWKYINTGWYEAMSHGYHIRIVTLKEVESEKLD